MRNYKQWLLNYNVFARGGQTDSLTGIQRTGSDDSLADYTASDFYFT